MTAARFESSSVDGSKKRLVYRSLIVVLAALVACNVLVSQIATLREASVATLDESRYLSNAHVPTNAAESYMRGSLLAVPPEGAAVNLPSIPVSEEEAAKIKRGIYGGAGDKSHLGGFTDLDLDGISPALWRLMLEYFGVKSLLDVGCGKGLSTAWFHLQGVHVTCVEGSHDAVAHSLLRTVVPQRELDERLVEHDFARGPWWPARTVDAVWAIEFLEHVGRNFHRNYLPAMRKAALIFCTHSNWGGWHHVEVHDDLWWISRFQSFGFVYSQGLTEKARGAAATETSQNVVSPSLNNDTYHAHHIASTMMVFINPAVASLPQHAHLFAEAGCFIDYDTPNEHCDGGHPNVKNLTPLPPDFLPIPYKEDKYQDWMELVRTMLRGLAKTN